MTSKRKKVDFKDIAILLLFLLFLLWVYFLFPKTSSSSDWIELNRDFAPTKYAISEKETSYNTPIWSYGNLIDLVEQNDKLGGTNITLRYIGEDSNDGLNWFVDDVFIHRSQHQDEVFQHYIEQPGTYIFSARDSNLFIIDTMSIRIINPESKSESQDGFLSDKPIAQETMYEPAKNVRKKIIPISDRNTVKRKATDSTQPTSSEDDNKPFEKEQVYQPTAVVPNQSSRSEQVKKSKLEKVDKSKDLSTSIDDTAVLQEKDPANGTQTIINEQKLTEEKAPITKKKEAPQIKNAISVPDLENLLYLIAKRGNDVDDKHLELFAKESIQSILDISQSENINVRRKIDIDSDEEYLGRSKTLMQFIDELYLRKNHKRNIIKKIEVSELAFDANGKITGFDYNLIK